MKLLEHVIGTCHVVLISECLSLQECCRVGYYTLNRGLQGSYPRLGSCDQDIEVMPWKLHLWYSINKRWIGEVKKKTIPREKNQLISFSVRLVFAIFLVEDLSVLVQVVEDFVILLLVLIYFLSWCTKQVFYILV